MKSHGFKTIPTGVEHGTVTVVGKHGAYELTSLRKDVETDGRRAVVEFGENFKEDALRRDFTFNAMYLGPADTLYDFHNGQSDLEAKKIRFVGDAETRIREDYLRIMRMFRFWAFSFRPDSDTLKTVEQNKSGLTDISIERIRSELFGILEASHPQDALNSMWELGVLNIILPELDSRDHLLG